MTPTRKQQLIRGASTSNLGTKANRSFGHTVQSQTSALWTHGKRKHRTTHYRVRTLERTTIARVTTSQKKRTSRHANLIDTNGRPLRHGRTKTATMKQYLPLEAIET